MNNRDHKSPLNILIIMVDQLNGTLFPDGPADWLHTPNLKRLAERSLRFAHAYTASPLCAPGRASFMSGQLPMRTRVYDNAAEFASDIPTYAHHLRRKGYATCLSGKMHFVGPDQLHGFEERLTTDIYPADFGWTPDFTKPGERIDWWYHNLGSVTGAGIAATTNQLEYDDEVAHFARQKLYELGRDHDPRPWMLTVSFTHPHDPYVARRNYLDLYADCPGLMPRVAPIAYEQQDAHSKRIIDANDGGRFAITERDVRRSRRAYFANISYLDDKVGELIATLDAIGQSERTAILFLSDHGDMLGERGLWFKMSFFDGASRVPLMMSIPDLPAGRIDDPVSTLDVLPTLADLVGIDLATVRPWTDGQSLLPLAHGGLRSAPVPMEYAAEGCISPMVALRSGAWKCMHCEPDPLQLYHLESDPDERVNRADDPSVSTIRDELLAAIRSRWDMAVFDAEVRQSQARRLVVYDALRNGVYYPWDYQPLQRASERYMRNHMDLNLLESAKRFPPPEASEEG